MTDLDPSSPDDLWAISDCLDAIVANPASVHGYSLSRLRDAAVDIRSEADYIEMTAARDALRARKIAATPTTHSERLTDDPVHRRRLRPTTLRTRTLPHPLLAPAQSRHRR